MEKQVMFKSEGQVIKAGFSLPVNFAACVVLSHGLEGDKDSQKWKKLAASLYEKGFASLRFNYRGCGTGGQKSEGLFEDTTVSARVKDFTAALDFVQGQDIDPNRLGAVGSSLGGMVIIHSRDPRLKALVTMATPFSFPKPSEKEAEMLLKQPYFTLDSGQKVKTAFLADLWQIDLDEDIKTLDRPLLVIHGLEDRTVTVENGRNLYRAANEPKRLKIIDGAGHSFSQPDQLDEVLEDACGWLTRYL